MSRHEGVSCDSCLKSNFKGRRYKCLICYDYDLCATCYEAGATTTRHTTDHPVQCIITRSDFDIFYGGEALTAEQPQAFSCPYCSKMGFTEASLQEHVTAEHADTSVEVVCPICASLPGGDPNHVTDDFAAHLTLEHRAPREFEPTGIHRHVRRIPHSGRGVGSTRTRRGTNMPFSSGGTTLTGLSSGREAMDPIAELLSQLSSVRSRAAAAQSVTSQLQQLEMQLQTTRQQLERTPRRQAEAAKATSAAGVTAGTEGQGATGAGNNNNSSSNSLYLLSRCTESVIDENSAEIQQERSNRSLFVQELLLSTLTEQLQINDNTIENMDILTEKLVIPSVTEGSKAGKAKSGSSGPSEGDGAVAKEAAVVTTKNSTETVCQNSGGATGVTSKTVGAKTVDKCGTKQKASSSVTPQNGKGATGSQSIRGVRQAPIHHQNQGERERHSQALHNIRQGTLMQNAVDLSNNLSLNVGRGGNSGYDSADNPQPLPGRPGSAGRDREGRLNPPTAKRNMVKHLPATKASDREPPPH